MLTVYTHNDKPVNVNLTGLKGYIATSWEFLNILFGKPDVGDEYKIDAEWDIQVDSDTTSQVFAIYNWKTGEKYCGSDGGGIPIEEVDTWNIGGHTKDLSMLEEAIKHLITQRCIENPEFFGTILQGDKELYKISLDY